MPDHDSAVASARSAADRYAFAWLARRRAYELLPADGPGRTDDDAIGLLRDAARRAFTAFIASLGELHAAGGEAQASVLILEVQHRTETPITEGN